MNYFRSICCCNESINSLLDPLSCLGSRPDLITPIRSVANNFIYTEENSSDSVLIKISRRVVHDLCRLISKLVFPLPNHSLIPEAMCVALR